MLQQRPPRATDLLLSFSAKKKLALQYAVEALERNKSSQTLFSTSTPAKALSPPTGPSFAADASGSFVETQPTTSTPQTQSQFSTQLQPPPPAQAPVQPVPSLSFNQYFDVSSLSLSVEEQKFETERVRAEQDLLIGAKAYFDSREFNRVIYMLTGCQSAKAVFLSSYSHFLVSPGVLPWQSEWLKDM